MTGSAAWQRAVLARAAFAVAPELLGGIWLRARSGPVRDRFMAGLTPLIDLPIRRLHPSIGDEALFGGLDVAASLNGGGMVYTKGVLSEPAMLLLSMAERARSGLAARLASALDGDNGLALVALDEGAEAEETLAPALADRLALHLDLTDIGMADAADDGPSAAEIEAARGRLPKIAIGDSEIDRITRLAVALGIGSLRAPMLALQVARVLAALRYGSAIEDEDLETAAALVLAPRATQIPQSEEPEIEDQPPEPPPEDRPEEQDGDDQGPGDAILDEMLLEAVKALLPSDLLDRLNAQKAARAAQSGAGVGDRRKGNRRGRPLPSRPGKPGGEARVDLVATLRAAAPWQRIRRHSNGREGLQISLSDIRLRQFEERSDRAVIFVVDASGSAALARLAEAKGAVELLLAQAYARRDYVALVAFRGQEAELLLPPTRSLVQTKRRLAALPGGGGTPLAAGLQDALALAQQIRGRGMSPAIALLTDGRANVALDGTGNRALAGEEATQMARRIRAFGVPSLVIDTGARPTRGLDTLAAEMGAGYLPLPRADAASVSAAVDATLGAG